MAGMQDHICSSQCMFCRVLDNSPQKAKASAQRSQLDNQVLDRVKELEQRTILSQTQQTLGSAKGDELERLALMDTLTELYNSRTFLKELKDELVCVDRTRGHGRKPMFLMCDGLWELIYE